ncbi:MAG TPA: hypothetical protein DCW53_03295, partial [Rikenellaceae bacterium]|nr:hypothetical protein [Rikenellaceae bacterium]
MAAALSVIIGASSCGNRKADAAAEKEEEQIPAIGFRFSHLEVDSTSLRSGETFSTLMSRLGLGAQDSYRLTTLCDTVLDLRKLKAGNQVR